MLRTQTLPFALPRINPILDDCCQTFRSEEALDHMGDMHYFSTEYMAWAIQNGTDSATLQRYLQYFSPSRVAEELKGDVTAAAGGSAYPILYFAAERNAPAIVRMLCYAGARPDQIMHPFGLDIRLPLLAFAVLTAEHTLTDTTDTVIALLAMGASPGQIPKDMWEHYLEAPIKDVPDQTGSECLSDSWCTSEPRKALCRNLNLMQRYVLWKTDNIERQPHRAREIAEEYKMTPLFETPYHIIGQRVATKKLIDCVTDHIMFKDTTPLVLLFTGPSGHGKTELARQMGELLSLKIHTVDCTEMRHETDIFGPKKPYQGWSEGAPLNNFFWDNFGERCVVFLDGLEKTTEEVQNALLKLFETGFYKDRRHDVPVDCSKVIWILAANLGCDLIQKFWARNLKDRTEEEQKKVSTTAFERKLKQNIITHLGAPFTGRLKGIIAFIPFNSNEQAVATYKFIRNL